MTDEECQKLVETLREIAGSHDNPWIDKAADEIERLTAQLSEEQKQLEDTVEYARRMRRERDAYLADLLRNRSGK